MKALYVEPFAGISGNMLLGALLDAGVPFAFLQEEFAKLHLGNYELVHKSVNKCGIQAQYFNVVLPEEQEHEHAHDGDQVNEHHHVHDHDCDHEHEHHHDHAHDHAWMHAHGIAHSHDHEPVLEEKPCGCDHHHNHEHNHDQEHHHEHHTHHHHHEHRNLHDIEEILDHSDLPKEVIAKAKEVFLVIAKAEAKVHGSTVEEIHFHEVGAIDTIIDVVGNILALQYLGIEKVFTTPVNTGFGFVECAHGQMPVPTPATAELLQGIPNYRGTVEKEMTTPTGAALLKVLASPVKEVPDGFSGETIGYGAGTRDVEIPNVLRVTMGLWNETVGNGNSGSAVERLLFLECNLDDLNPEIMPYVLEKLLAAGALDAWLQPVIMKKGRPAQTLKVLCSPEQRQVMEQIMFTQTTTLGVRAYYVERTALERRWKTVQTPWGEVRVKEGLLDGKVVNAVPEFEDCKKIAEANGVPLKAVETAALQE
ncbi:MAG: nickel pincer cofactor biosynthesis protein LarC [Acidaminococcaceae bacterium]|nr:nickel pincer cofactor biosynthesis protein LarC [Acidaminococcaceae bacterium]MBQ6430166.1 nickel pincer cofactor biosynthesis protein LarC [Acidaminococcaceae bacterium]MBR4525907.1 nickel pincer cofactor biosynthesis protein LarC [Acidaminococcaceae bacterium]MBR6861411.1 nickel pincer cofactor biosynthesis protein LarC [Acidaminococcaceae bacterium]